MQPYANLSGQSNVKTYQTGVDFVIVEFMSGRETFYKYTYASAGSTAIGVIGTFVELFTKSNGRYRIN